MGDGHTGHTPQRARNRVLRIERMRLDELADHPRQFRTHPEAQRAAVAESLERFGFVGVVPAYLNHATGRLTRLDGHCRAEVAPDAEVDVAVTDLSDEEADAFLLVLDQTTAMAEVDTAAFDSLLREVGSIGPALDAMLAELAAAVGMYDEDWSNSAGALPDGDKPPFQQMTFTLSDEQAETVKAALDKAKDLEDFAGSDNANSNGNALAALAEAYLNG